MTTILDRLEKRTLVRRERTSTDRRQVIVSLTDKAYELLARKPRLLQDEFVDRFLALTDGERSQIVSTLEQVAELMDAGTLTESAPHLATGPLTKDVIELPAAREH